jgi:heme exporter protein A
MRSGPVASWLTEIPYVEVVGLTRIFGRHYALHRVDARLNQGEVSLILGPNGAGKSTLLSILATLDRPSAGKVFYGDGVGRRVMEQRGRGLIGWVAHDSLVYSELTGAENLRFYARLYGLDTVSKRVDRALRKVGLESASHQAVRTYSRGMRQRLSVARALLNSPRLLILDEPFTGLDGDGRRLVTDLLLEAKEAGCLVILSTHVLDLPRGFVDHTLVLKRGRRVYHGPPGWPIAEFYESVLTGQGPRRRGARAAGDSAQGDTEVAGASAVAAGSGGGE